MIMEAVKDRYLRITENINKACGDSGRDPKSVKLVVVTKKQPVDKIIEVLKAGATALGENYPQEAFEKKRSVPVEFSAHWHMIGHIQSRKIKYIVDSCDCVHTIDRLDVAKKLNQACSNTGLKLPVLVEVNISGEENKQGYRIQSTEDKDHFYAEIEQLIHLNFLDFCGLMTMPPFSTTAEESRWVFRGCRLLLEDIQERYRLPLLTQLSMGTSQDYEVAIQEGATYVRIGEAIMGERTYP